MTASDQSPSGAPDLERRANAETVKHVLDTWVDDQDFSSDRSIDVGIVKLTVDPAEDQTNVVVELRFAVSDDQGKMVSVLSGTSKVSVPGRAAKLPKLRREALIAATQAVLPKLRTHLHAAPLATAAAQTRDLARKLAMWFSRISPRPVG